MENRHTNTQRNLQFDEGCSGDFEETSPTFPAPEGRSNPRPSGRTPSLSTPQHTPLSRSAFGTERQFLQLQRQITTLTEKIDSLRETASSATHQRANTRRDENLPRDMVVRIIFTECFMHHSIPAVPIPPPRGDNCREFAHVDSP